MQIEITLDFRSNARAKQNNCRWPAEIFEPLISKVAFNPPSD